MTPLHQANHVFSFLQRAINFQDGVVIKLALFPAFVVEYVSNFNFWKTITEGVSTRDWMMPFVVSGISLLVYLLVFAFDFYTGMRASKKEAADKGILKGWVESGKLWSSVIKFAMVNLVMFILCSFAFIFALMDSIFYSVWMWLIPFFFIGVIRFDLHSINENHFRATGSRFSFLSFIDSALKSVNEKIFKKIS
ncbi:MAG TPA: hypothetical protein VFM70_02720 [Salinimicrobium sp.]|nr:hypothetical protein [Salinimicrobium sp.]